MIDDRQRICPDCDYLAVQTSDGKFCCNRCGQLLTPEVAKSKRWHNDGVLVTIPQGAGRGQ